MYKRSIVGILVLALALIYSDFASAESFGVCNQEMDKVKSNVQEDYKQWIDSVNDMPQEVRDAYIKIFTYNRDQAFLEADKGKEECYAEFRPLQKIVDGIVLFYTRGLSKVLPEKMTHIDVSQIMAGKPLGGPNAAVPKFREQTFKALGIDPKSPGTVGTIIKDPWKCLTFQRKC
ncbi:MAG: hypothetical protein MPW14_20245 [Candidatus Manganitrophus sp.]|nr:hypothetical protein [Candidatus Manganitrophus sp.]MDC4225622.1 hypothetical protein [Candidatus Manganitrophus sp.]WDT73028.1 MAG: hypothetical protein MPW17_09370 [Candidatus Manganitrophus sp.]WDT74763.1 MAG: hypothetical protein MPW16_16045 [Candidatus Manganitrophus sp.]WDT79446.1 MAG: hypothetical protein MPW14_20245 [Candidatus Manganitrophus sp.]